MEDCSLEFLSHMEKKAKSGGSLNMQLCYQEFTLDVIARIAMGQHDSQMFNNPILADIKAFFESNRWQIWMLAGVYPPAVDFLKFLFNKLHLFGAGPFVRVQKMVNEAVTERIKQRENDKEKGIEQGEPADFIDLFLDAKADVDFFDETNSDFQKNVSYNNRQLTTQEIISQSFVFMIAGFDTTALSLSYVTYLLATNPDKMKLVQEEIDRECRDPSITFEQLAKLKYTDNVMKESARMYPLAGFATSRRCMRTTRIGEYTVEAGTDVMVDIWELHYDKKIWGQDADEFTPERWESGEEKFQKSGYLPFGLGPRQCMGMRLAQLEEKLLLAHLLRKYSFEPTRDTQIPMKLVGRSTMRPESLNLKLVSRYSN